MKKLFEIAVGHDEDAGKYCAIISSLTDKKHRIVADTSMRRLLPKIGKPIREKTKQVRNCPIVEPSRTILANGNSAPRMIVPARN